MTRLTLPALLLTAALAGAADPAVIRLPVEQTPAPQPMPGVATKLTKGMRYVIACKVKCDILTFPDGLVAVEAKTGPRDWTARFAGGTGDYEDRTYPEPFLYALKATGTGPVKVVVIPQGYKDRSEWVTAQLDVDAGEGPRPPPPTPVPPKPDEPKPPAAGLRVLMVYESGSLSALPESQKQVLYSVPLRDELTRVCAVGADGTPEWRVLDANKSGESEGPAWSDLMKRPRASVPWVVIVGKRTIEQPLPATVADMLALLKKASE